MYTIINNSGETVTTFNKIESARNYISGTALVIDYGVEEIKAHYSGRDIENPYFTKEHYYSEIYNGDVSKSFLYGDILSYQEWLDIKLSNS